MSHRPFSRFLKSRQALAISIGFTLVALAVRLIGLSLDSLWYDEVFSIRVGRLAWGDIIRLSLSDVHSPLYLLLLNFWTGLFGETESAVRMFSVLFSVLTVFVIYHLALRLFNSRTAFFAALFITLSPFHVFYAQETRVYSLLTFVSATSVYFFVSWLKEDTRLSSVLYVISTAILLYTHLYAAFVVMAQVFYFALLFLREGGTFARRVRRWLILQLITASLFLPWAVVVWQQATRARQGFWISEPDWLAPFRTLLEYCGSLWLTLLLLPLFIYGVKCCCEQNNKETRYSPPHLRAFLLLWLILTLTVPFFLSKLLTPFYLPKYTIAASLPFYLFAAWGLEQVGSVRWQAILVVLICVASGAELSRELTTLKRERWRDATYNIEQAAQPGDLVLFNSTGTYLGFDYYAKRKDLTTAIFPYSATDEVSPSELTLLQRTLREGFGSLHPPQTEQEMKDKLHKIVGTRRRVWLVTRYGGSFKNDFINVFQNAFRTTSEVELCVSERRFLFRETYGEAGSAIFLEQRGLTCAPHVYLLER